MNLRNRLTFWWNHGFNIVQNSHFEHIVTCSVHIDRSAGHISLCNMNLNVKSSSSDLDHAWLITTRNGYTQCWEKYLTLYTFDINLCNFPTIISCCHTIQPTPKSHTKYQIPLLNQYNTKFKTLKERQIYFLLSQLFETQNEVNQTNSIVKSSICTVVWHRKHFTLWGESNTFIKHYIDCIYPILRL